MTEKDPIARDIAQRNPETDDQVAGEQVLGDEAAPEPDDLLERTEQRRSAQESP